MGMESPRGLSFETITKPKSFTMLLLDGRKIQCLIETFSYFTRLIMTWPFLRTTMRLSALISAITIPVLLFTSSAALAEDKKPELSATLVSSKETYPLDPAQSGDAFKAALKARGRKPAASKVELTFKITNNTDQEKTITVGGDSSQFKFTLEGPGAVTVENMIPMTRDFRVGQDIKIAPGKSHDIAITSLSGGMRGMTELSYFTEPGDYKLTATLTAGEIKITSDTLKFKVEKAEEKK
jgi:hypothetical protein